MEFHYNPTGILYKNIRTAYSAKTYKLKLHNKDGIFCQKDIIPLKKFRPEYGWIESNEPEEHLDKVAIKINENFKQIENILCFSYKDLSLANRVRSQNSNIDILFANKKGLLGDHFEEIDEEKVFEKIKSIRKKYDLVIIRHYLEHFENIKKIMMAFKSKMSNKSICFLEVPDCNDFIRNKNPIFLWEQHRWYFTYRKTLNWLKALDWDILNSYSVNYEMEPSLCFYIQKTISSDKNKQKTIEATEYNKKNLSLKIFDNYLKGWEKYIKSSLNKFALLGVGHNSDRFLQWTNTRNNIDFLIDESKEKQGMFLAKCKIEITNNKEIFDQNTTILLGVHPRNTEKLKGSLLKKYNVKNIFSIFQNAPEL